MPCASRIRWTPLLFALLQVPNALSAAPPCTQTNSISQWQCWEQAITSSVNFYAGTGNPYRDLILRVHFVSSSGESFDQDAYWVGNTAQPTLFKVRTAFRAGTWNWSIAGCSGITGGISCASNVTWTPSSGGPITVSGSTAGPQIYARGFLKHFGFITPTTASYSQLLYDDYSPFFWAADTAWAGPGKDAVAAPAAKVWNSYIADRASKQFHGLLVAPAALTPAA